MVKLQAVRKEKVDQCTFLMWNVVFMVDMELLVHKFRWVLELLLPINIKEMITLLHVRLAMVQRVKDRCTKPLTWP